ncbi:MAG TPA: S24 family peptidase [Kaistia sp.]|nr:S24 family peptidase [Kaistia sp.]
MAHNPFREPILGRLKELNKSVASAGIEANGKASFLQGLTRPDVRPNPTAETIRLAAKVLQVPPEWFSDLSTPLDPPLPSTRPAGNGNREDRRRFDVPVRGVALGSVTAHQQGFSLGRPHSFVERPKALDTAIDVYAVQVANASMAPMHPPGQLRFVHPGKLALPGDTVIVRTKHHAGDPGQDYIKILKSETPDEVVLTQLNPIATIEVPRRFVEYIHKVLTTNELFGF